MRFLPFALALALTPIPVAFAQEPRVPDLPPEPPPAPARVPVVDTVYLRGGGLVRGRIHEILPGDHVTLTLETGETRSIPWAEVDRAVISREPAPPPAAAPEPASEPEPASHAFRGPLVRVHIASPRAMHLYRNPAGTEDWTFACDSPCDMDLPLGDGYRFTGAGAGPSKEFRLEGRAGGAVAIAIDPPSTAGMAGGGILGGIGGAVLYVGSLVALGGSSAQSIDCGSGYDYSAQQCQSDKSATTGGLIAMGVGAAAMVVGLVVLVNASKTDVTQHPAQSEPVKDTAWLRLPTWHTAPAAPEGATFTLPILHATF